MPKVLRWALIILLLVVAVVFALANHQPVDIQLDPLSSGPPTLRIPLFAAIFLFMLIGVVIGGTAAWFGQAKWRRRARQRGREADGLARELTEARAERASPSSAVAPEPVQHRADPYI